ncbi:MAG: hypothetical protein SNH94_02955 [Rikenellaceae bacterium]
MNRVFTSIILALGLINSAVAQNSGSVSQPQDPNEVVVLSSYVDGNYNVERLLVMESSPSNNEFVVRYKINITKLISSYDNNSSEIAGLHNFIESIQNDSLKRITHYDIVGYASPDGPSTLNQRLATARAEDFSKFVDKECQLGDYPRTVIGKPYSWIDTKSAVQSSNLNNKGEVLTIIESAEAQSEIQKKLEQNPSSWSYFKNTILPPMRSVEIHIAYNSWRVVENRTLIEEVEPAAQTVVVGVNGAQSERGSRECATIEDDYINCMIIEMPGAEIDYDDCDEREKLKVGKHSAKYKERGRGADGEIEKEKIKARKKRNRWWN